MTKAQTKITNLQDLCDFFSADEPAQLNKRIYRATGCGASISVRDTKGKWYHNGQDWSGVKEIQSFTIQTIVEGADPTVDSDEFVLPVTGQQIDEWIEEMESEAASIWEQANNPSCTCGHPSDKHDWRDVPNPRVAGEIAGYECQEKGCACQKFEDAEEDFF